MKLKTSKKLVTTASTKRCLKEGIKLFADIAALLIKETNRLRNIAQTPMLPTYSGFFGTQIYVKILNRQEMARRLITSGQTMGAESILRYLEGIDACDQEIKNFLNLK